MTDAPYAGLPRPPRARPRPAGPRRADVVVVGSGIAGLTAALRLRDQVDRVLVVTKDVLDAGSTQWAQGGIAAALGPGDTPEQHVHDTLVAGAGACDAEAVRVLVTEGPDAVRELIALGTDFDHDRRRRALADPRGRPPPRPDRARRRRRHRRRDPAGADRRGRSAAPEIEVIEHALAVDLLPRRRRRRRRASPCT